MTKAKNAVIAGDFMGKKVSVSFGKVSMDVGGLSALELNSRTVAGYSVVDETHKTSMASGVMRGMVGGALFGGAGMVASAMTAKQKGVYQVVIQLIDDPQWRYSGKRFLLEVDEPLSKIVSKFSRPLFGRLFSLLLSIHAAPQSP